MRLPSKQQSGDWTSFAFYLIFRTHQQSTTGETLTCLALLTLCHVVVGWQIIQNNVLCTPECKYYWLAGPTKQTNNLYLRNSVSHHSTANRVCVHSEWNRRRRQGRMQANISSCNYNYNWARGGRLLLLPPRLCSSKIVLYVSPSVSQPSSRTFNAITRYFRRHTQCNTTDSLRLFLLAPSSSSCSSTSSIDPYCRAAQINHASIAVHFASCFYHRATLAGWVSSDKQTTTTRESLD